MAQENRQRGRVARRQLFLRGRQAEAGTAVLWIDHCAELRFDVIGHNYKPGAPLRPPASGRGLALITCYPTDALFYTPDRFVLLTTLRATSS